MLLQSSHTLDLSIIIPAYNEAGNLASLIDECVTALTNLKPAPNFEIIVVNDCSSDDTLTEALDTMAIHKQLRVLTHKNQGGKSAALRSGFQSCQGKWIATLDGDGQNDPRDLAQYWQLVSSGRHNVMYAGVRRRRNDGTIKMLTSRTANKIRRALLDDGTRDTGCGFKIMPLELVRALPYFDNMHRFFPALARREGYDVKELSINDRPRLHGQSKYGFFDRAAVALLDVIGVFWLKRRKYRAGAVEEVTRKPEQQTNTISTELTHPKITAQL